MKKYALIISVSIVLLFVLLVGGGYLYIQSALNPVSPKSKTEKLITIPVGSTVSDISSLLESKGVIKNATVFKYYVRYKKESGFKAGTYKLSPSMSVPEIISQIRSGKVSAEVTITIPEGTQLKEIAQIIAKAVHKPEGEVFKQLNNKAIIKSLMSKYPQLFTNEIWNKKIMYPLEGYLFPATYPFYKPNPTVDEIATAMVAKTNQVLSAYQSEIKQKHMTNHQLLTMASLIENEATGKADRNKIASVFYNRLQKGMPLQTDPTILYAEGKHKQKVFYKDLAIKSPYNTYTNTGLPPGPISNAGEVSIEAALHPAVTEYYYFLAAPNGDVVFSKTLAEHDQEKAKYISNQ